MYSVQCTVYNVQCTVYSVQCTVYNVQCTMYSVQCTVYNVQCTMYSVQCTVYTVHACMIYHLCDISSERASHAMPLRNPRIAYLNLIRSSTNRYAIARSVRLAYIRSRSVRRLHGVHVFVNRGIDRRLPRYVQDMFTSSPAQAQSESRHCIRSHIALGSTRIAQYM